MLAGGEFSLAGGQWLDAVSLTVCEPCPELDPAVVYCEGTSVKTQPGHYAYFISEEPRRAGGRTTLAVADCPNQEACKYEGLVDAVCETSLAACNANSSGKCAQGYTGNPANPGMLLEQLHCRITLCPMRIRLVCINSGRSDFPLNACRLSARSINRRACLQDALDCKTCPNPALSIILAIVIGIGLYLVGIVLGKVNDPLCLARFWL